MSSKIFYFTYFGLGLSAEMRAPTELKIRFKRNRERGSPYEENIISKVRINGYTEVNEESTEHDDIFNNEDLENPPDEDDGVAR